MLKKIECIIQPQKLEKIKRAFRKLGADGITVSEVRGCGLQRGYKEKGLSSRLIRLLPKVKIEIITEEERVEKMVESIRSLAETGKIGAGKIFVLPVEDALRIRTKETGRRAIE